MRWTVIDWRRLAAESQAIRVGESTQEALRTTKFGRLNWLHRGSTGFGIDFVLSSSLSAFPRYLSLSTSLNSSIAIDSQSIWPFTLQSDSLLLLSVIYRHQLADQPLIVSQLRLWLTVRSLSSKNPEKTHNAESSLTPPESPACY